jgi:hypothetical protein
MPEKSQVSVVRLEYRDFGTKDEHPFPCFFVVIAVTRDSAGADDLASQKALSTADVKRDSSSFASVVRFNSPAGRN